MQHETWDMGLVYKNNKKQEVKPNQLLMMSFFSYQRCPLQAKKRFSALRIIYFDLDTNWVQRLWDLTSKMYIVELICFLTSLWGVKMLSRRVSGGNQFWRQFWKQIHRMYSFISCFFIAEYKCWFIQTVLLSLQLSIKKEIVDSKDFTRMLLFC